MCPPPANRRRESVYGEDVWVATWKRKNGHARGGEWGIDAAVISNTAAAWTRAAGAGGPPWPPSHAASGVYEAAVAVAADFFIGNAGSTMSINVVMMRSAGGVGVGGGGGSRIHDMVGFAVGGPYGDGRTGRYHRMMWETTVEELEGKGMGEGPRRWGTLIPELNETRGWPRGKGGDR